MGADVRSDEQYLGIERSLQRAWAKGAGLIDEEFERPMIAVVNTCQEFSPENIHLRQVGDAVKAGIRMAGGTPCEFNTFHVTDSRDLRLGWHALRTAEPRPRGRHDRADGRGPPLRRDGADRLRRQGCARDGDGGRPPRPPLHPALWRADPGRGSTRTGKSFSRPFTTASASTCGASSPNEDLKGLEDHHFPFAGACDTATSGNTAGIYTEALGLAHCRTAVLFRRAATTSSVPPSTPACGSWSW